MPFHTDVRIDYGPYKSCPCGVPTHRTPRLEGMQKVLTEAGNRVTLNEIEDWNILRLVVKNEVVFTCNIDDLDYGGDGQLDNLVDEAAQAVLMAF